MISQKQPPGIYRGECGEHYIKYYVFRIYTCEDVVRDANRNHRL